MEFHSYTRRCRRSSLAEDGRERIACKLINLVRPFASAKPLAPPCFDRRCLLRRDDVAESIELTFNVPLDHTEYGSYFGEALCSHNLVARGTSRTLFPRSYILRSPVISVWPESAPLPASLQPPRTVVYESVKLNGAELN